jgi:hypothetical protein
MILRPVDSWHCTDSACKAEISVQVASQNEGVNPRCICGSPMKKKYSSPVFRYLDFLQVEDKVLPAHVPCHQSRTRGRS